MQQFKMIFSRGPRKGTYIENPPLPQPPHNLQPETFALFQTNHTLVECTTTMMHSAFAHVPRYTLQRNAQQRRWQNGNLPLLRLHLPSFPVRAVPRPQGGVPPHEHPKALVLLLREQIHHPETIKCF